MAEPFEPYSKRKRKLERSGKPAVFQYDRFPDAFRMQAYYALESAIGEYEGGFGGVPGEANAAWDAIEAKLRREHGLQKLSQQGNFPSHRWMFYLRGLEDIDLIIDTIEVGCAYALLFASSKNYRAKERIAHVERFISELNARFREHDLGYEFVSAGRVGFVTKIDSQYVHAEVVEPAIASLHAAGFDGPLEEFATAHQEYRRGDNKGATNEAHKAFESTMKAICSARGWQFDENANATKLIKTLLDNGLIPKENESFFNGLRTILESGTPTLRNRRSAHGQGPAVVELPDYFAAFALHLTAASIVFLMAAHQAAP